MAGDLAGEVVVIPAAHWAATAAERLASEVAAAVTARGRATLMLAGGTTPRPVYQILATIPLPWDRIDVFFGDERAVPPGHPESNYRMAQETLFDPAGIPAERRHRMTADDADLARAARSYAALLPDRVDVLLLGIGSDGHTASLFPGSRAVQETARRVVPVAASAAEAPPYARLTVTPPVITAARRRAILARGAAKATAVARARGAPLDIMAVPAQLARPAVWLLDAAAAAHLLQEPARTFGPGVNGRRLAPGDAPGGTGSPPPASA